jgi:hypothetical protein
VLPARSGQTEDDWLAGLAVGRHGWVVWCRREASLAEAPASAKSATAGLAAAKPGSRTA